MNNQSFVQYASVYKSVDKIIHRAKTMEESYKDAISRVHEVYSQSARNLVHYLAFRSFDIDELQSTLSSLGLPSLTSIEGHVMYSLLNLQHILNQMLENDRSLVTKGYLSTKKASKIIRKNNKILFGYKSKKRRTRIMVTLPSTAADDPIFVNQLIKFGMNCARINCAHDNPEIWLKMVKNVRAASIKMKRNCKIAMDLAGPKLRTGSMIPGPKVIHIKPVKNDLGQVVQPAQIWIAPPDIPPPPKSNADSILPVDAVLCRKIKRGNTIYFTDSRNKKCKIQIDRKQGKGRWGLCSDSAYLESGTAITLHKIKQTGKAVDRVGELLPKEQFLTLFSGDTLVLHKDDRPGENAKYDDDGTLLSPAHISCTLKQVFDDVKPGEPIFFDDGKIEGMIRSVSPEEIRVGISHTKANGSKLKADKGINLPDSDLSVSGLTEKDHKDLEFVAQYADAVNFSFVNSPEDVLELYDQIKSYHSHAGVILKIETQKAFARLPEILLTAMQRYPVGVMIARGDLAIETGWKNFASIQQEIVRICGAAHIPDVWATQVLENLAKKGTPSRSEITDAALAQQAECVMLNKGVYILKAVRMLDKILRRMQRFQRKTRAMLPKLEGADKLLLSHKAFDII
jgi:pyruvate kinase